MRTQAHTNDNFLYIVLIMVLWDEFFVLLQIPPSLEKTGKLI